MRYEAWKMCVDGHGLYVSLGHMCTADVLRCGIGGKPNERRESLAIVRNKELEIRFNAIVHLYVRRFTCRSNSLELGIHKTFKHRQCLRRSLTPGGSKVAGNLHDNRATELPSSRPGILSSRPPAGMAPEGRTPPRPALLRSHTQLGSS